MTLTPYILVRHGGIEPGKRPRTKLARVVKINEERKTMSAHFLIRRGETKRSVPVPYSRIIHFWDHLPTDAEIRKERLKLEKVPS